MFKNDEMMEFKDYRIRKYIGIVFGLIVVIVAYLLIHLMLGKLYLVDMQNYIKYSLVLPSIVLIVYGFSIQSFRVKYRAKEHTDKENVYYLGFLFTSADVANWVGAIGGLAGFILSNFAK